MDMTWGDEKSSRFVTNVGLITSNGPHGNNVMAAEWTRHISYSPGLVMVNVRPGKATHDNILKTKEFGISIAASDQGVFASVAGKVSGKEVDKISVLKDLGFKFFKGKNTNVLLVEGAVLKLECKLIKKIQLGSHTAFIGEIVESYPLEDKEPLIYYKRKYWKFGEQIQTLNEEDLKRISELIEKHKKK